MSVAERYEALLGRIARAAASSGRDPSEVRLIGAAKRQPLARLREALRAGLRDVGENYVQEAAQARDALRPAPGMEGSPVAPTWHLIGRLQRNKARDAVSLFDCIHSVDRARLVEALEREALRAERHLDVLMQINLSGEARKAGVAPEGVDALADRLAACQALRPVGLMTMPAPDPDPEAARVAFEALREIRDALRDRAGEGSFRELSMGMSADLEVAVEEGATMVRIGTALFGARETT